MLDPRVRFAGSVSVARDSSGALDPPGDLYRRMGDASQLLVERGMQLLHADPVPTKFTGVPAADELLNDLEHHSHAFVLACVADRQVKAEVAWRIPYELSQRLGGFSFDLLDSLSPNRIRKALYEPTPLHRFPDTMSENAYAAVKRIGDQYDGNAANIWLGSPSSAEVVFRFLGFRGIGPKIATMATNILARDFKISFGDYYSVDVSVDVHLRRVFTRLGLVSHHASDQEIIYRARALHPPFPGLMDLPAWEIGRKWCRPKNPTGTECYMQEVCPTAQAALAGDLTRS